MNCLKRIYQPICYPSCGSVSLLLLRLIAGTAFAIHGWGKIQHPMSWAGPDAGIPGILLLLAAVSEFGGGLAWILGLLTPLASFGIACTMAVATSFHLFIKKDPFVNMTGGSSYEPALVYLGIAILFMMMGPGKFSLDAKIFGPRPTADHKPIS